MDRRSRMRVSTVVHESIANLWSRRMVTLAIALIAVMLGALTAALSFIDVSRYVALVDDMTSRGANVLLVTSSEGLSAKSCEALVHEDSVMSSGVRVSSGQLRISAPAEIEVLTRSVSQGYLQAMWPGMTAGPGVVIGAELAERLGVESGSYIAASVPGAPADSTLQVGAVAPHTERDPAANDTLFMVVPASGNARQCLVETYPRTAEGTAALVLARMQESNVHVAPIFAPSSGTPDPRETFKDRYSQYLGVAGALMLGVLLLGYWLLRAADFALYRVLHVPIRHLSVGLLVETLVIAAVPMSLGFLLGYAATQEFWSNELAWRGVLSGYLQAVFVLLAVPALGTVLILRRDPIRLVLGDS